MKKEIKKVYPKDGIFGTLIILNDDGTLRWDLEVIPVLDKTKNGKLRLKYGVTERGEALKNTLFSYEYGPRCDSISPLGNTPIGAIKNFFKVEKLLIDSL